VDLLAVAAQVAARARADEQVECYVGRSTTTNVKAFDGEVEAFTSAESWGVGVRVIRDHRQGFASAGSLDADVVDEVLADARDNAAFAEADEWLGLAEPDGVTPPVLEGLCRPGLASFATTDKVALALALERAVRAGDDRITGVRTASYGDWYGEAAVATSTGLGLWSEATSAHLSVTALAADGERTQVGGGVDVAREPGELAVERAASDAVLRATRLLGATKAATQRLAIVLEPRLAVTLLGIAAGMLNGERVLKGRSPFADRVGEAIASPLVTLADDPTDVRSLGADAHDGEGLATRRNVLVDGGVLRTFLHDAYTGRRSGTGSTASAVRGVRTPPSPGVQALAVAPGRGTLDELIADVDLGLLVQSFSGLHSGVNSVSGDFSVGAEGLMIRGGSLAEPVREVTIASTVPRLLLDIAAVGSDLEWLPGGSVAPTIVIPDVQLSGA
jgi:PmbA protein